METLILLSLAAARWGVLEALADPQPDERPWEQP